MLANIGTSILVQRISGSQGLDQKRKMDIPVWKPKTTRNIKDKDGNIVTQNLDPKDIPQKPQPLGG